jgi:hypothetical protein
VHDILADLHYLRMMFLQIYTLCSLYSSRSTLFVRDILADRHCMFMISSRSTLFVHDICADLHCRCTKWCFGFYLTRLVGWNPMGWGFRFTYCSITGRSSPDPHICLLKHSWLVSLLLSHSGSTIHLCFGSQRLLGDPLWMCMFLCLVTVGSPCSCLNDG